MLPGSQWVERSHCTRIDGVRKCLPDSRRNRYLFSDQLYSFKHIQTTTATAIHGFVPSSSPFETFRVSGHYWTTAFGTPIFPFTAFKRTGEEHIMQCRMNGLSHTLHRNRVCLQNFVLALWWKRRAAARLHAMIRIGHVPERFTIHSGRSIKLCQFRVLPYIICGKLILVTVEPCSVGDLRCCGGIVRG